MNRFHAFRRWPHFDVLIRFASPVRHNCFHRSGLWELNGRPHVLFIVIWHEVVFGCDRRDFVGGEFSEPNPSSAHRSCHCHCTIQSTRDFLSTKQPTRSPCCTFFSGHGVSVDHCELTGLSGNDIDERSRNGGGVGHERLSNYFSNSTAFD